MPSDGFGCVSAELFGVPSSLFNAAWEAKGRAEVQSKAFSHVYRVEPIEYYPIDLLECFQQTRIIRRRWKSLRALPEDKAL